MQPEPEESWTTHPERPQGGRVWRTVRPALALVAVCGAVAVGMRFVAEGLTDDGADAAAPALEATAAEASRPVDAAAGARELVVPRGPDGHFVVNAVVNGVGLRFLVDTGASAVVLSAEDARRAGLRPGQLSYDLRFRTANGEARGASVTLRELRIGQMSEYDLPAVVLDSDLPVSLLGMSFLERLEGWEVRGGRLVLQW